jgi:hypothetical protein
MGVCYGGVKGLQLSRARPPQSVHQLRPQTGQIAGGVALMAEREGQESPVS